MDVKSASERIIPQFDYFFSKGIMLCGDANWNKDLNTAELFIYYKIADTAQISPSIHMNEAETGVYYE